MKNNLCLKCQNFCVLQKSYCSFQNIIQRFIKDPIKSIEIFCENSSRLKAKTRSYETNRKQNQLRRIDLENSYCQNVVQELENTFLVEDLYLYEKRTPPKVILLHFTDVLQVNVCFWRNKREHILSQSLCLEFRQRLGTTAFSLAACRHKKKLLVIFHKIPLP